MLISIALREIHHVNNSPKTLYCGLEKITIKFSEIEDYDKLKPADTIIKFNNDI